MYQGGSGFSCGTLLTLILCAGPGNDQQYAFIAQQVEQALRKREVVGSIPIGGSIPTDKAQAHEHFDEEGE